MILSTLFLVAQAQTAVLVQRVAGGATHRSVRTAAEAELAMADDIRSIGERAALRKWAMPGAVVLTPRPVTVEHWLAGWSARTRAVARSMGGSYASCDGSLAVNTGSWRRVDGTTGHFTTVWRRPGDGSWRWVFRDDDARQQGSQQSSRDAICPAPFNHLIDVAADGSESDFVKSRDGSMMYSWHVNRDGSRDFDARIWTGRSPDLAVVSYSVTATP